MKKKIDKISFEKITLKLGERVVLSGCDFDFPMNKKVRMIFNNDVDKFAFLHAFSQVDGMTEGKFKINDDDVMNFSFEEFLPYRLNIGFGFSTRGLINNRSIEDNLLLPLLYHKQVPRAEAKEWVDYLCDYFMISEFKNKKPSECGPSPQKAALILRAFVGKPEMIILDSPELLLSNQLQANLLQLIDDHYKDYGLKHLFFATQNESLSDCMAEDFVIMKKNKLVISDTHKQLGKVA